jgi:hypothetical protein
MTIIENYFRRDEVLGAGELRWDIVLADGWWD